MTIDEIKKRLRFQNESITFNEEEALRLTIQKHACIDELTESIRTYDEELINYYKTTEVPFSGGLSVDLESDDERIILANLAKRIYKTRNSIVHSKEGEKRRYLPFKHDRDLNKEMPLIRFLSEIIIVSSSKNYFS